MDLIPLPVVYAGLGGTLLALIVATATNKWQPKVFFLLALRLAIGWQFLFEGLHKIHSHMVGPTETSKPFTSEPYFKVAPGPVGAFMRKQSGTDPMDTLSTRVMPGPTTLIGADFAKKSLADQAAACPGPVAAEIDALLSVAEKNLVATAEKSRATSQKEREVAEKALADATKAGKPDGVSVTTAILKAAKDAETKAVAFHEKVGQGSADMAKDLVTSAKAKYARWVHGVDRRDAKARYFITDVPQTVLERLDHLRMLNGEIADHESRLSSGLGMGTGTETARLASLRNELLTGFADLAKDAETFVAELKKELIGNEKVEAPPATTTKIQRMDQLTMWFIAIVGACILAGLFTRLSCVLAAGFLVMTYLTHPPFPWYTLPPGTEGNPLFVNKNLIECFALLALACMPTGRWLGIDALIHRLLFRKRG